MRIKMLERTLVGENYEFEIKLIGNECGRGEVVNVGSWYGDLDFDHCASVYPKGLTWAASWFVDEFGESDEVHEELCCCFSQAVEAAIKFCSINDKIAEDALNKWEKVKFDFINNRAIEDMYARIVR